MWTENVDTPMCCDIHHHSAPVPSSHVIDLGRVRSGSVYLNARSSGMSEFFLLQQPTTRFLRIFFFQPLFNLNFRLYTMSFSCSICHKNLRSLGGLKRHVHSKHLESSTLTGMAEAAKKHTFIRHPHLSGKSESISLLV